MNRDDINRIIQENGLFHGTVSVGVVMDITHLEKFAAFVAAAEREACAKLLDEMAAEDKLTNYYKVAALRIRERGAP